MPAESEPPDIRDLSTAMERALWVLAASKKEGKEYLSAREIAARLTETHKIATEPSTVRMAFSRAPRRLVHVKKGEREKVYAIMKHGEDHLTGLRGPRVVLIDPEKAFTSRRKVEELFQGFTGLVKICDPHVDPKTIDPLTAIPKGSDVRLLTANIYDSARLRREMEAYRKEYSLFEVRTCRDKLHDRYVITKHGLWLLGHSLNGLGKKETFIINLGPDMRMEMEARFDSRWSTALIL